MQSDTQKVDVEGQTPKPIAEAPVPADANSTKADGPAWKERGYLEYDDGPLVWIDCEMTGLETTDRIIEIAVIITDGQLNEVDEGIEYVIQTSKEVLDAMGEWCTDQHGKSGLTQSCLDSPHTHAFVHRTVAEYIKRWIPERGAGVLAGSSVHADKAFLLREMPEITGHLSYRLVDVSSLKELCKRWFPTLNKMQRRERSNEAAHRALDDIRGSIRELQFYRQHMFIPPSMAPPAPPKKTPAAAEPAPAPEALLGEREAVQRADEVLESEAARMAEKIGQPQGGGL